MNTYFEIIVILFHVLWSVNMVSCLNDEQCNFIPLGIKTDPLPADDRFAIQIVGVQDYKYIPNRSYTVRLYSREPQYTFIAFTISAKGDTKYNEKNPRRPIDLDAGRVVGYNDTQTVSKEICPNTVFQADVTPKTEVKIIWMAPPKDNKCVTLYAYVAVKPDVYYKSDGPLSQRVCEDRRQDDDMPPPENYDCSVCEDARYEMLFEGSWSYNTHPLMFPEHHELAKFSDIVGASHSKNFYVFRRNSEASEGLKMLAEQGNSTQLEIEISDQLGENVRTIIKATGPPTPDQSTIGSFRTSKDQHYISIVTAIIPSPDWFLGVPKLELCTMENKWAENVKLNLYPLDAGTDSGLTFESPNEETSPPKPIGEAAIAQNIPREEIKPFATIKLKLIRTYATPYCATERTVMEGTYEETVNGIEGDDTNQNSSPGITGYTNNVDKNNNIDMSYDRLEPTIKDCAVTIWDDWLPCEGACVDNVLRGYRTRFRYFYVNGQEIGKNFEDVCETQSYNKDSFRVKFNRNLDWLPCEGACVDNVLRGYRTRFRYFYVNGQEIGKNFEDDEENAVTPSEYCFNKYPTIDTEKCEEDCEDTTYESPVQPS